MSVETKTNAEDGETTTISAEQLANATTMIGEDGTQYIIVMDESGEGDGTAIAVPEGVELSNEGGSKDDTVMVVPDGEGNYRLVDSNSGSTGGATLIVQGGEGEEGMQFLVDDEGNLLIDEEGNPLRMAMDQPSGETAVLADEKSDDAKYLILEDEDGRQMVVDASSLGLSSASPAPSVESQTRPPIVTTAPSRIQPREVFTKKAFEVPGGSLSVPVTDRPTKVDLAAKVDKNNLKDEVDYDWAKIDPKKLTFNLSFGCIICKEKSYKTLERLVKHRKKCPKKEMLACGGCAPSAREKIAQMVAARRKQREEENRGLKVGTTRYARKPQKRRVESNGVGTTMSVSHSPSPSPSLSSSSSKITGGKSVHGSTTGALHTKSGPPVSPAPVPKPPQPSISKATMDMKCRVCGKQYQHPEQLKMHLINVHLGTSAFTPQVMTPSPMPTAILSDGGPMLQAGHETVQLIAGEPTSSASVIGQWVA